MSQRYDRSLDSKIGSAQIARARGNSSETEQQRCYPLEHFPPSGSAQQTTGKFVATRQLSRHPVVILIGMKECLEQGVGA
jgi:hypothetical protein